MNILEKEIEDVVWNALTTDVKTLRERGFPCDHYSTYFRQVDLGNYGISDIIGIKPSKNEYGERIIYVTIYELKKEKIGMPTLLQAARYAKGLEVKFEHEGHEYNLDFSLCLIGKTVETDTDFIYLPDIFCDISYYTYSIDLIKGITFKERSGYHLTNNGFKKGSKDVSSMLKVSMKNRVRASWEADKRWKEMHNGDQPF